MFIKDKKDIHNVFNQNYIFQKVYLHSYIYRKCLNMSGVSKSDIFYDNSDAFVLLWNYLMASTTIETCGYFLQMILNKWFLTSTKRYREYEHLWVPITQC